MAADRTGQRLGRALELASTHRVLGIPLFLAAMWVAFKLTTDVAAPFVDWIDAVVSGPLHRWFSSAFDSVGLGDTWLGKLIVDGLLVGVGAVLAFVPVLLSLYLTMAVLEDSGYLDRSARAMDGAMAALGLPGQAFLPLMLGFGCTVPALLALRSLKRPRDRVLAGLMIPFMSCGARLPVYVLMATAFFVGNRTLAVFSMYVLGLAVAGVLGYFLSRTVLRDTPSPNVMPEPARLRWPNPRSVLASVGRRTRDFLRDAGTVILGASLVVWVLMAIPMGGGRFGDVDVNDSAFAGISRLAAPALGPLGFGDWEQAGSLITGLVAKEVVVGTLAQAYGLVETAPEDAPGLSEDLREIGSGLLHAGVDALAAIPGIVGIHLDGSGGDPSPRLIGAVRRGFESSGGGSGEAAALAFMAFVLLYTPCAASLATTRRELGVRWMLVSAVGQGAVAWVVSLLIYRIGLVAGLG